MKGMNMRRFAIALAALLTLAPSLARPVCAQLNSYEQRYGSPVDVSISDLIQGGMFYTNRAVRTRGTLQSEVVGGSTAWTLRDAFAYAVQISPVPEVAQSFSDEARLHINQELYITGVPVDSGQGLPGAPTGIVVEFWKFETAPDRDRERLAKAKILSIADLLGRHGRYSGQLVHVAGTFHGRNLFGDLPAKSERGNGDWVLADEGQAVWIIGKKPKGPGWALDPLVKSDAGKWIEVVGRPETRGDVTYIHAEEIGLTRAPERPTVAELTPTPPPKPKAPPVVVFTLPLDGETEVPGDSRFVVQFSKDMDEDSFKGRVELRYLGPPHPGTRPLDAVSFNYDGGLHALVVDPGDRLRRGGELELRLLPGIKDIDGLELIPREATLSPHPTRSAEQGVVDVLYFRVGT
jgi:hypothetical protein